MRAVLFRLNGDKVTAEIPDHRLLVELLQDHFLLTGCRESCGQGVCGTCTVLLDGALVSACLLLAAEVDGREVTTVEGLSTQGQRAPTLGPQPQKETAGPPAVALHPVQEAFLRHFAFQCGYCTPGMMLAVLAYLREGAPGPAEEYLRGNICRCGCYAEILRAVDALR
jgi:aerobic-type carbon monoxide dehydrogenase small subunit (CoxS/CutS family)